jgi:predicted RNA-binding protein YlqC (UPF0109 family)
MLVAALDHLVRGIVDRPDDVRIKQRKLRRGELLEIHVHPDDLGRVIGRGGRTARALRRVINAIGPSQGVRLDVVDTDRQGS